MSVHTYEQIPYQSKPYDYATADRMAVVGGLFGLPVVDPSTARVLEIGCAGGGNLIPRALAYPQATFYGIDPAENHVAEANSIIAALGVGNVRVDRRMVEDLGEDDGLFDYIVAHGVYSWIPPESQIALMAAIRDRLAPNGIAYVSYNVLPGWHMRTMVREAMLFHIEPFEDPTERVEQALAMLGFLAGSSPGATGPWKRLLQSERDLLSGSGSAYVFHDHLSPDNTPIYFRDFVKQARGFDLEYLGEAHVPDMMTLTLPDEVQDVLGSVSGDLIRTQQYLDFLFNRTFRRSLLVHADVAPDQILNSEQMGALCIASSLRRPNDAPVPLDEGVAVSFTGVAGRELTTDAPEIKAAWAILQEAYPSAISFSRWVRATAQYLEVEVSPELVHSLATNGLYAFAQELAELHHEELFLDGHEAERPLTFAYARLQAFAGAPWVTTRRHDGFRIDELDRHILTLCDGTRTADEIRSELSVQVRAGELQLGSSDETVPTEEDAIQAIEEVFEGRLFALGKVGALVPQSELA